MSGLLLRLGKDNWALDKPQLVPRIACYDTSSSLPASATVCHSFSCGFYLGFIFEDLIFFRLWLNL